MTDKIEEIVAMIVEESFTLETGDDIRNLYSVKRDIDLKIGQIMESMKGIHQK